MRSTVFVPIAASGFALALFALLVTPLRSDAATLWTGTNLTFVESSPDLPDVIIPGKVSFARKLGGPLYNPAAGELGSDYVTSPADTLWAFGALTNYTNLTFDTFPAIRLQGSGDLQALLTNRPMVVHLLAEDIYLAVTFTSWTRHWHLVPNTNGFIYVRSTPFVTVRPTVNITNPVPGATFTAPATLNIAANATASGSPVTNVVFYINGMPMGSAQSPPFHIAATNVGDGAYSLSAVALAGGIAATSPVVSINVVVPVPVSSTNPSIEGNQFSFSFSANPGLNYVVESTSDFRVWVPRSTNQAGPNPVHYSEPTTTNSQRFFRVVRLPDSQ